MLEVNTVRKILVTGNAGSGKTTFSKQIAALLEIQVYSLDRIVWQKGWKKTPQQQRDQEIAQLIAKDSWIIDGVSTAVMDAADLIIFLDFSRSVCYSRVLQRTVKHLFHPRPEFSHTTPEIFVLAKVLRIIWRFPLRVRAKILAFKERGTDLFRHISSEEELDDFLLELLSHRID